MIIRVAGGTARIATPADVEQAFRQLNPVRNNPQLQPESKFHISADMLALAGEILGYSLTVEEVNDCLRHCAAAEVKRGKAFDPNQVNMLDFENWWNSDQLNPNLQILKSTHSAKANGIEGSGTMFG